MRLTEKKENGFYELKEGQEIYGEENGIRLVQIVGEYEDIDESPKHLADFKKALEIIKRVLNIPHKKVEIENWEILGYITKKEYGLLREVLDL